MPPEPAPGADAPRRTRLEHALLRMGDALAWIFFATFLIGVTEVALRYLLNAPTSWAHATSTTLCVAAFAVGGAYAMARGEHLRVTVVSDRLRGAARIAAEALALACGTLYLAGLAWGLGREAIDAAWRFEAGAWTPERTPGPPHWPLPTFGKAALLAGALLFLAAVLAAAWRLARARRIGPGAAR